ncbi:hypothetical protein [Corynebacterium lizhenjunii]|uniref:hypothetical protein n=1 Tax=Corynebacterium lizhenjunii TaxID=2709394 RepID=UPI0013EADF1E|nr:hypothetical protein [Corynebacterium lizhenjunii]
MDTIKKLIQQLTDDEFLDLRIWVTGEEKQRRDMATVVEAAQAQVVKDLQDAGKLPLPDALTDMGQVPDDVEDVPQWTNPGTDHSAMYREGDIVAYKGRVVRSTHKGLNSWEPGTLNFDGRIWEDITPPGGPGHGAVVEDDDAAEDWEDEDWEDPSGAGQGGGGEDSSETATDEGDGEPAAPDEVAADETPAQDDTEDPGEEGELDEGDEPAPFKQPTGAHDAYPKGARVSYKDGVYESVIPANVYAPDVYPAGWKQA